MTPKAWNIAVLVATLIALTLIGGGVWIMAGLGASLAVTGACLLGCVILASLTSLKVQ